MRERAALHGIQLEPRRRRTGSDCVTADELRLKQVLLNLLSNAVKFTPGRRARRGPRAWREARTSSCTVTDTGIGIAPADQERIFDSFQQGERSASTSEGTGLGLTLSQADRRAARGHDVGDERARARAAPSASRIPQAGAERGRRRDEPLEVDEPPASGPTVVVIEDDPRSAELVELHLRAAGLRAVSVGDR